MVPSRRLLLSIVPALLPAALAATPGPALAESAGSPVATVRTFYDGLLRVMKEAARMSFDQRYAALQPIIRRAFDLSLMTRIAVGPQWAQIGPAQQRQLYEAFARYTVSVYANRFDGYSGERFVVNPAPVSNPNGVVVQSHLVKSGGDQVVLNYLMRQTASGVWQIIDVYLSGTISELATRRSEFAAVLRREGAEGLVRSLDRRAAALRTG